MLNSRQIQGLLSLQRHIPGPAVLAAANAIIACSVPKTTSMRGQAPFAAPQAALHTHKDGREQVAEHCLAPKQPSAASLDQWHRQPAFHTSSVALLAGNPQDGKQGGEEQPPTAVNSSAVAGGAGGEGGEEDGQDQPGDDASAEYIEKAFEDLILAAYELVQEGKPMEAEYVLREGAKSAESILGENCIEVAPLYDQLAMISFFHDRVKEAKEPALKAFSILMEREGEDSPATAVAGMRYAVLLLAGGEPQEALKYFNVSIASLEAAIDFLKGVLSGDDEDMEDVALAAAKFEVGLGESLYYKALAELALGPKDPDSIRKLEEGMLRGIHMLKANLGTEQPLVAAALREHHRLVEQELEADDFEAAEALYGQQLRLHQAYDPQSEHTAMLGYQIGTLQYVMGKYAEAAATLERSLSVVRTNFEDVEDYLLTVKHRLGMAHGALGQHDKARALLEEVRGPLAEKLGEDNPITHELTFMAAMMEHKDAAGDAARRGQLLQEMQASIAKLGSYGEEHMLVKKAQEQLEQARGRQ